MEKHMGEQNILTVKKQISCIEENLIVDSENLLYSLSNSLDDIEIAIFARTGENIDLKNTYWKLNKKLFIGIKHLMNKYQVKYSMTVSNKNNRKDLVVNMRIDDEWFITGFTEIEGSFKRWDQVEVIELLKELLKEQSKKLSKKTSSTDSRECENLTINEFINDLDSLFKRRRNNELTFRKLNSDLSNLIWLYDHLKLCIKIKSYNLDKDDFFLFMCFCHLFINNNDDKIGFYDLKIFYENNITVHEIMRDLSKGEHILVKNKYIECNDDKDTYNSETWRLSDKTKKELFSIIYTGKSQNSKKDLVLFKSIKSKKMFYNNKENEVIVTLITLLKEENYKKIRNRVDAKGMQKGFTCLFSGGPGTGKTETAFQIARETKRNIIKVDIAKIKSCWIGESEKNMREVFNNYRTAVNNSEIVPILLFNEADSIIHKRTELDVISRSTDRSDNAVQNIILEEMEKFSGILIATTNFVQSMDGAFERRFLYKITFDKPSMENREGIWNTLFPDLPKSITSELAGKFELSGGQIENIARKVEVDTVLSGNDPSMDSLLQHCRDERDNSFNTSKKIGFGNE